jgi:3-phosphoshikimate 1-carboxyvinyltransferase
MSSAVSSNTKSPSISVGPLEFARGEIDLPGSKSISNRVLLLSALASGVTRLHGLLDADDTRVMRAALKTLGIKIDEQVVAGQAICDVHGADGIFPQKNADLFMGNAGTAIRPLTAALAVLGGEYHLHGVPRMHERPIRDLVDGLNTFGAQIDYLGQEGYPPIQIHQARLDLSQPVRVRGDVSSQFLTALLMALPLVRPLQSNQPIMIEVIGELISKPYIEITLKLLSKFGVDVINHDWQRFEIPAASSANQNSPYTSPKELWVEGDASSASYFLAAGAIGGGPVKVRGVGHDSIQGDVAFADALALMGANISKGNDWIEVRGVDTPSGKLQGIELDCTPIPDAAMTLAVAGLFAEGTTRLTGIASWRVKETDRIAAMAKELRKMGATVREGDDFIEVQAPTTWMTPADGIDTYDDHRMAMCFSLAAFGPKPVLINDPDCVAKTFPDYFAQFAKLVA